jgi:hypothetical protein
MSSFSLPVCPSGLASSATPTVTISSCQKFCANIGLLNACGTVPQSSIFVTWTVGNSSVATVNPLTPYSSPNAIITGVNAGSTTVTAQIGTSQCIGGGTIITLTIPIVVLYDTNYTTTFSFGTPVSKSTSLTCASGLVGGPIQPQQVQPSNVQVQYDPVKVTQSKFLKN